MSDLPLCSFLTVNIKLMQLVLIRDRNTIIKVYSKLVYMHVAIVGARAHTNAIYMKLWFDQPSYYVHLCQKCNMCKYKPRYKASA